ncbi:MAG: FG-GAP repeat protein [Gemmatimonadales bacterium]
MRIRPVSILTLTVLAGIALAIPAAAQPGNFGRSGAVLGRDLFVGQPANFYGPGTVYLYRTGGAGAPREMARLVAPDSAQGDDFGSSLAADGEALLVGAPGKGDGAGSVYLFTRRGGADGRWTAAGTARGEASSGLGAAIALRGREAFAGAPAAGGTGVVRVFGVGPGGLTERVTLRPAALTKAAGFGASLSQEGDLLLVGAPGADSGVGAAVVFRRGGDGWVEDAVLRLPEAARRAALGVAVLLHGGRAFVSALGVDRVFVRAGGGLAGWRAASGRLEPTDGSTRTAFGATPAAAGSELVGAPNAEGGDGAVHLGSIRRPAPNGPRPAGCSPTRAARHPGGSISDCRWRPVPAWRWSGCRSGTSAKDGRWC